MNRTQARRADRPAETDRPARAGHPARTEHPALTGRPTIRPACAADLSALSDFFADLSARSRYLRFFAPVTPGPALLRLLSGDPGNADAVIAVHGAAVIGHAMAVDQERRWPRITDIGVVVADAWQDRGVGSALMRVLLARAWARGITFAAMDVLPGNRRVLAMIARHWPSTRVDHTPDCITIRVSLPPAAPQQPQPVTHVAPVACAGLSTPSSARRAAHPGAWM